MTINIAAYRSIIAGPDDRVVNLNVDIETNSPELRNIFARAMAGERVINEDLMTTLTGKATKIYEYDFDGSNVNDSQERLNFRPQINPIVDLERIASNTSLNPEETGRLEAAYAQLAIDTTYDTDVLKYFVRFHLDSSNTSERVNSEINELGAMQSAFYIPESDKIYFTVPRYNGHPAADHPIVDAEDLPPRGIKIPKEAAEFIVMLHEAEHAKTRLLGKESDPYVPFSFALQPEEIDCDLAIIKFLRENGMAEARDNYLEQRMVTSFKAGLSGEFDHDTATFIRMVEQTGQHLDIDKFIEQKSALMTKIAVEMDLPVAPDMRAIGLTMLVERKKFPTTGDIMGATEIILNADKSNKDAREIGNPYDESAILTDVQRAEAQRFMDDAKNLGYVADDDYKVNYDDQAPSQTDVPVAHVTATPGFKAQI